jgi:hypothetical protein
MFSIKWLVFPQNILACIVIERNKKVPVDDVGLEALNRKEKRFFT